MPGGRRPGAGHPTREETERKRQPGSEEQQAFVKGAQAALPEALEILQELARGIWVEGCGRCKKYIEACQCNETNSVRIYRKPPDRQALEVLVEHGRGRAGQAPGQAVDTQIFIVSAIPRPKEKVS